MVELDPRIPPHVAEIVHGISPDRCAKGPGNEYYLPVSGEEFQKTLPLLASRNFVLIGLFCTEGSCLSPSYRGKVLYYVFEKRGAVIIFALETAEDTAGSIARTFPSASWFERECADGFGIRFSGSPDDRRLFLHEVYPKDFHPLLKSFRNAPVRVSDSVDEMEEYRFRQVSGPGVYQVPVGPVHAGIIEPGHFRFSVIGETILNLEIRMFYKHRGIEKLAEGKTPGSCVAVSEAVSGDESVANAVCFCMAAERISGAIIPDRAWHIRTILLELERISSHLRDQSGMLVDVAFPFAASHFSVMGEELQQQYAMLTGSRFMRGMVVPGGVSKDLDKEQCGAIRDFIREFRSRYTEGLRLVLSTTSVLDRFATTGIIRPTLLRPLNITGPAARASGGMVDVRINHPYGIYDRFPPEPRYLRDGDVLSRFTVKASEVIDSMPAGEVMASLPSRDGYSLAVVEAARGQNLCWVWIRNGLVERYKVRTASFCNWQAIEHAVQGNIVADFPVINKSLNLSYAGTDL
jgi:Ni,Fe-hydrogenase III large subunit/Ni,Fe-hydrogenase III component G